MRSRNSEPLNDNARPSYLSAGPSRRSSVVGEDKCNFPISRRVSAVNSVHTPDIQPVPHSPLSTRPTISLRLSVNPPAHSVTSEAREIIQNIDNGGSMILSEGTKLSRSPSVGASHMMLSASATQHGQSHLDSLPVLNGKAYARKFLGTEWNSHLVSDSSRVTNNKNYDFKCNIAVVGSKGCGKRALLMTECETSDKHSFHEGPKPVNWGLSIEFKEKSYIISDKLLRVEYWIANTSDDQLAKSARILSNCAAVIFVYDVNNRKSFSEVQKWLNAMDKHPFHQESYKPVKVLLANDMDPKKIRLVSKDEGSFFADANKMFYHESNPEDRKTFKDVFYTTTRLVMDPIIAWQNPCMPGYALSNGFVRTRAAVTSQEKLSYFSKLESMLPENDVTTSIDWL
ncbi:GTP-binding protein of the rab [Chytriomyces hyalinus]|nr:GTP-binding protein of the rab [Chytriomyces hyalinus]